MTKKIFALALAMLMFAWAGMAQSSTLRRSDAAGKLTSINQKLGNLASNPLKASLATKDANDVVTLPWLWDFSDSVATGNTWTGTDSTDMWSWFGAFGNNGDGCVYASSYEMMVTPAIAIPSDATTAHLSFYIYGEGDYVSYIGYPSIGIFVSTTGNAYNNFDLANPNYTASSTSYFVRHSVDLSAYAGDTIYIAFACNAFYSVLALDDVKVSEATAPEYFITGDYYVQTGVEATFTANYIDGDTTQTTDFTWSSALGTITGNDETATVIYTTPGTDTITLITHNSYGDDTAYFYVEVISCATITELPYTESFEDPATAYCWTMVNASTTAATDWNIYYSSSYAYDGNSFLYTAYDTLHNSNCYAISPAIQMPEDANGYILSYYVRGRSDSIGIDYSVYEVLVSTTDNNPSSFTMLLRDTTDAAGYELQTVSLANYGGNTIYIAFRNVAEGDLSDLFIDYVQVRSANAPVFTVAGPAYAQVGTPASFTSTHVEGSTDGMTYTWTSTMAAAGQATIATPSAANTTITYTASGTDMVIFHAHNAYGDYYDTLSVNVISCESITSFPWTEDFEGETANCWMLSATSSIDLGFEFLTSQYAHSGQVCLWGNYSDDVDVDQWAISPAIVMPAQAEGMVLEFYALTSEYNNIYSDYEVLLSNGGTAISDFTTVLFSESGVASDGFERKFVSLSAYAGQTIRIAFHNKTAMGGDALLIDDVNIHSAVNPVFTVDGPASVFTGDAAAFTATYVEGVQEGMTYSWTSTMADAGQATISGANTTSATITYSAGGTDHVTFTATNAHGTFTQTLDVEVVACNAIGTFPYVENFEDNANLACWSVADMDGDGGVWFPFQGSDQETGAGYGHNSNGAAFSASYDNNYGPLNPDNWLIGPAVAVPDGSNLELSWYAKGFDPNYASEHYSVYISTTGNTVADFTEAAVYSGTTTGEWERQNVSLAAYAGQTIHFAFRHHDCSDMYYLVLDDVQIAGPGSINSVRDLGVSIYPNPASSMLRVEGNDVRMVELLDVNGRSVLTAIESNVIDLGGLADGVYMVRVTTPQGVATEKVIKR